MVGLEQEGPILGLLRSFEFDEVILYSTPNTRGLTQATQEAIRERQPQLLVDLRQPSIEDPTDYLTILTALRSEFAALCKQRKDVSYNGCFSGYLADVRVYPIAVTDDDMATVAAHPP